METVIIIIAVIVWLLIGAGGVLVINAKYLKRDSVELVEFSLSIVGVLLWVVFVFLLIDERMGGKIKNPFYKSNKKKC